MANEITYALVKDYLPQVWESALMYLSQNLLMPGLVRTFNDRQGFATRSVTQWIEGTVDKNLGELQDLTPTAIDMALLAELTPRENGVQYLITDRRVEGDPRPIFADAARKIAYEIGKAMEQDIFSNFPKLTGGVVGTAGAALDWATIYQGRARLATAGVPAPYSVVLHEYQWFDLATAANIAGLANPAPLTVRNDIQNRYYLSSAGDMNFYASGLVQVDGSDDATGAIFNPNAMALDMRRGLRIEAERDASLRATELNATIVYAHGTWDAKQGVRILSDATPLGTAVTANSDLILFGIIDDATAAVGQDVTFTVVLTNVGTVIASNISVTLTIPSNFTYISDSPNQGTYSSGAKIWEAGDLTPGSSAVLRVVLDATSTGTTPLSAIVTVATPADSVYTGTGNIAITVA